MSKQKADHLLRMYYAGNAVIWLLFITFVAAACYATWVYLKHCCSLLFSS